MSQQIKSACKLDEAGLIALRAPCEIFADHERINKATLNFFEPLYLARYSLDD